MLPTKTSVCRMAFLIVALVGPVDRLAAQDKPRPFDYGTLPKGAWHCLGSPRFIADAPVLCVAFSPDGKLLATGTGEHGVGGRRIHIWSLETGRELSTFGPLGGQVVRVIFTADSKRLVSGAWDKTIRVWDLFADKEERRFKGHEDVITGLELTGDNKRLVSSSQDGTIRVWDFAKGEELRRMKGGFGRISLAPDGHTVIAGGNGLVQIWDIETGEELRRLGKPSVATDQYLGLSADGKTLAKMLYRAFPASAISLWDVGQGTERQQLKGFPRPITAVAFSHDGKMLATGCGGYEKPGAGFDNLLIELKIWNLPEGKLLHSLEGHSFYVDGLAFSADDKVLASVSEDFTTRLWDVKTGQEVDRFAGHGAEVTGLTFTSDGKTLCSSSQDGTVRLWSALDGGERGVIRANSKAVRAIALTPDGKTLASGGDDDVVRLWDVATRDKIRELSAKHGGLQCLAFSPDGGTLVSGGRGYGGGGGSIRLWDWRGGKERLKLAKHDGAHDLAFSPDGAALAVGHHPRIMVFETATGAKTQEWLAHGEFANAVAYLPGGSLFSAGGGDQVTERALRLWDSEGKRIAELSVGKGYRSTMAVSPDGRLVAFSVDTAIEVWETSTRQKVADFQGNRRHASVLAFHPDGRTLASGGADGAILFWDLTGMRKNGKLANDPLAPAQLADLWKKLADPKDGRPAVWRLVTSPQQAVSFLRQRIGVAEKGDEKAEDLAAPPPGPVLQGLRAIEALERIGTPEARQALEEIADGVPSAWQTQQARAALKRLP